MEKSTAENMLRGREVDFALLLIKPNCYVKESKRDMSNALKLVNGATLCVYPWIHPVNSDFCGSDALFKSITTDCIAARFLGCAFVENSYLCGKEA